jgi:hypothetical protein
MLCSGPARNGSHLKSFLKLSSNQLARTPKSAAAPSPEGGCGAPFLFLYNANLG